MLISSKGRHALRIMLELAEHYGDDFIPMKDMAQRQGISKGYIAQIMPILSKNGLVDSIHGKGGGYRLARPPRECTVGEILHLTEESLAPVSCLQCDAAPCERAAHCKTLPVWRKMEAITNAYIDSLTLQDILDGKY